MLAVMPLFNNNSFSNTAAMAQEYDKYGDSSYSTYPTDDKKYECRTGQFEGFFVSSVEFCKDVKFDNDRKDKRIGTQGSTGPQGPMGLTGPQGATGPQGEQGERGLTRAGATGMTGSQGIPGIPGTTGMQGSQGPPGPNQINRTLLYFVNGPSDSTTSTPFDFAASIAFCDGGDVAIGGNSIVTSGASTLGGIRTLQSGIFGLSTGYFISIETSAAGSMQAVSSNVHCFDNPPLRP